MALRVNSRPGYGVRRDEVRFNVDEGEEPIARLLRDKLLEKELPLELRSVAQGSQNYLSVFFCGS
jgi:hypothetical protein